MFDPAEVAIVLFVSAGTWAFLFGAILIRGGSAALRARRTWLVLMAVAFLAVSLAAWQLGRLGGAVSAALFVVSLAFLVVRFARRANESAEQREQRAAVARIPAMRRLMLGYAAFIVLVAVMAAVLGRMSAG